ncbi:hypothetical protein BD410DRAFT_794202 [Rickenella mellea]|uniref:RNI-like protein n=1 Tax=Rickenella mellea TaxID=50990 RepID=A0A4Y7PR59_9AGAM|nr:hypothetical protein BD410DRAFT_794202 [Rickenella mellea]
MWDFMECSLDWEPLVALVSRSNAVLHSLEIHGVNLDSYPRFLATYPNLTHLGIAANLLNPDFNHALIQHSMSSSNEHSRLCPNLTSLRILCDEDTDRALSCIRSIVDIATMKSSVSSNPWTLIVPSHIRTSLNLQPCNRIELLDEELWMAQCAHDLYAEIDWE